MARPPLVLRVAMLAIAGVVASLLLASGAAAAPPAISGADGDVWSAVRPPTYTITGDPTAYIVWEWSTGERGVLPPGTGQVTTTARRFDEGPGRLQAVQLGLSGAVPVQRVEDLIDRVSRLEIATRTFTVDLTPPGAVTVAGPATATAGEGVAFAALGGEPGAGYVWRVDGPGGTAQGPFATTAPQASVGPLPAGSYGVLVQQVDAGGNTGPVATAALAVTAPPAPPPAPAPVAVAPATTRQIVLRLPTRNAGRLTPRKAANLTSPRPTLGWKGGPARTTLYNVQVFRVTGVRTRAAQRSRRPAPKLVKVHSAFPERARYRMPAGKLARGGCYVWRVWPFVKTTFTKSPLGVSHFCVARRGR